MSRIYCITPTFKPVGGVVKVFDYANHALDLGHEVVVCCPEEFRADLPLFQIDRFRRLDAEGGVPYIRGLAFGLEPDDLAFFSWPEHYEEISFRLGPDTALERVIHLVQNVRHGNPKWIDGYAARLLTRPMARIMVSRETMEACEPYLNTRSFTRVIPEGHAWDYFSKERRGGLPDPIKVGYTTWKSNVGIRVEEALVDDPHFEFRSIRETVSWDELRELYHWSDVLLGTPGPEEGFYLVGLEALAAGALLISADAWGNRAYSDWGENCLLAEMESEASYTEHLHGLRAMGGEAVAAMRAAGYATLQNHTLERERDLFARFLEELEMRPARPDLAGG